MENLFDRIRKSFISRSDVENIRTTANISVQKAREYWCNFFVDYPLPNSKSIDLRSVKIRILHPKSTDIKSEEDQEDIHYSVLYGDINIGLLALYRDFNFAKLSEIERDNVLEILIFHEYIHYVTDLIFLAHGLRIVGLLKVYEELAEYGSGAMAKHFGLDSRAYTKGTLSVRGGPFFDKSVKSGSKQNPNSWVTGTPFPRQIFL